MSMTDEERSTLVRLELEKAHDTFEEIEILRQAGKWNGAANRVYYSVFHAVNALFINDGLQSSRHKASHALFSLHYIKTGKLPADYGRLYNNLQTLRESIIAIFASLNLIVKLEKRHYAKAFTRAKGYWHLSCDAQGCRPPGPA